MRTTIILLLFLLVSSLGVDAQRKRPTAATAVYTAIVVDETLSVLRKEPSLYAEAIQRMRRGRKVRILGVKESDGVRFFRVQATPPATGWVQADAVFSDKRVEDEERLAKLVQASSGFEQIEAADQFFQLYQRSKFRPPILLLYGDILEIAAVRLSRDATSRLDRREMAASGAPLHSYYLNFNMLDRYRRLGLIFLFNSVTKQFHYDGASWKEIVAKFPTSAEAVEAQNRLNALKEKLEKKVSGN